MIIVVDKDIPFIEGVFENYASVRYIAGSLISARDVSDADALVVRTRTRCDRNLLEGSRLKLITSATIGTDHIDLDYCNAKGILVRNAAGCNAGGVMNYVFSALYGAASRRAIKLENMVMGIIGVGNVGRKVERMASYLGLKVLKNDPPRAGVEGPYSFVPLDVLLRESNIVTMHVPLLPETRNMCNTEFFSKMQPGAFFINASRGEVVDEDALMNAIPKLGPVIIDTWNNEPQINTRLLEKVDIATPHIAGYSYRGKQNGTASSVRAVAEFFGIDDLKDFFPCSDVEQAQTIKLDLSGKNQGEITSIFQYNYPIFTDDFLFRLNPYGFEHMRAAYNYRREFDI